VALLHWGETVFSPLLTKLFKNIIALQTHFKVYIFLHVFTTLSNRSKYVYLYVRNGELAAKENA
jgi:hypothetical protein